MADHSPLPASAPKPEQPIESLARMVLSEDLQKCFDKHPDRCETLLLIQIASTLNDIYRHQLQDAE